MSLKRISFILIFLLIIVIAVFNQLGSTFFLYWKWWWFDIVMHFLGGLWIGLVSLWVYYFSGYFKKQKIETPIIFLLSFLSVLFVGIGWEIFEFIIEVNFSNNYIPDTALDLIMDILGGIIASVAFTYIFLREKINYGKI